MWLMSKDHKRPGQPAGNRRAVSTVQGTSEGCGPSPGTSRGKTHLQGLQGRRQCPGDIRALDHSPSPPNRPLSWVLDTQRGPGSRVACASSPAAASSPAPAPTPRSGIRSAWCAVAVNAEEASGGIWEAEAAHAGPEAPAARTRVYDGVARTAIGQPARGAAVQQLQLPRGEELAHLGHCCPARRTRARCSSERHRPQWLQEEHASCGGDVGGGLLGPFQGLGLGFRIPPSCSPGLQGHSLPCSQGPQPLPRQCWCQVFFDCCGTGVP